MNADRLSFVNFIFHLVHGKRKLKKSKIDEAMVQFVCDKSFYSEYTNELDIGAVFQKYQTETKNSQPITGIALTDKGFIRCQPVDTFGEEDAPTHEMIMIPRKKVI